MSCGIPYVTSKIEGMPNMIKHGRSGYLAKPHEIKDLAKGLVWILEKAGSYRHLINQAWEKVEREFALDFQGRCYPKKITSACGERTREN